GRGSGGAAGGNHRLGPPQLTTRICENKFARELVLTDLLKERFPGVIAVTDCYDQALRGR
ncbi:MAG: hypothetical protein ACE5GB_13065, partial [Acidimicrobiales bacterium]